MPNPNKPLILSGSSFARGEQPKAQPTAPTSIIGGSATAPPPAAAAAAAASAGRAAGPASREKIGEERQLGGLADSSRRQPCRSFIFSCCRLGWGRVNWSLDGGLNSPC